MLENVFNKKYIYAGIISLIVLVMLVVLTMMVWNLMREQVLADQRHSFEAEINLIVDAIHNRTDLYTNALRAGNALFKASEVVSRDEWTAFANTLDLQGEFPGIQGYGFAHMVDPEELEAYIAQVRVEGFPEFAIHPAGERAIYSTISYLEPLDKRNLQAFGYDMTTEGTRRSAMELARDTGKVQMSGRVTLVQEIDEDVQAGFLIYVPTYQNGLPTETTAERRNALMGYVYSPFRARDFMEGILGERISTVDFAIFDGTEMSESNKMFDSSPTNRNFDAYTIKHTFEDTREITLANRTWTIFFTSKNDAVQHDIQALLPILILGIIVAALIAGVVFLLMIARLRAVSIAETMTEDIRLKTHRLESLHSIITLPDLGFEERLEKTLSIVVSELELDAAVVSRIVGEEYTIEYSVTSRNLKLNKETLHKLGDTYCKETLKKNDVVVIGPDANISKNYPCHLGQQLETYIGVPLTVDGMTYGTLSFLSEQKLTKQFTEDDKKFVQLVGKWISRLIKDRQIDNAKDEFVSLASHQLRTPLSAINWYTEMLSEDETGPLNKNQQTYLDEVRKGSQRMVELVESLLNISQLDLGTYAIKPEKLTLTEVLAEVIAANKERIELKNITYEQKVDPDVDDILSDRTLLNLVFDNLISNAIKYSHKDGTISVTVEGNDTDFFKCTIKDTGYGIPEKEQHKIFTKMFRATNALDIDTDGTGLGLYMVQSLVGSVGGTISFVSKENHGTTFTVTLPKTMTPRNGASRLM